MAKVDVTKEKWVAMSGSVFTERTFRQKPDLGVPYLARQSVMFNVGDKVANHVVKLHNASLEQRVVDQVYDPRSDFEKDIVPHDLNLTTNEHGEYIDSVTQLLYRGYVLRYIKEHNHAA